jgi:uncharacterized protein YndB with AHSA1/START domain
MANEFTISVDLPATPERVYTAWLSTAEHSDFTGSEALIDPTVGGSFSAWDGYITGKTLALEPHHRIVQSWRTTDFARDVPDSRVEVIIDPIEGGSRLTLVHTNLPEGTADGYRQGWEDWYFAPMVEFFKGTS